MITYVITVSNRGEVNAQTLALLDTIPTNTTFVSFTQNTGPAFTINTPPVGGTGDVTATIASLAAGATATFTLSPFSVGASESFTTSAAVTLPETTW